MATIHEAARKSQVDSAARKLLQARARRLARIGGEATDAGFGRAHLQFALGRETYALQLPGLLEIIPVRALAHLPGTPDFIAGLIPVRGRLVSLVDLAVLMGLSPAVISQGMCAVILGNEEMSFALPAGKVEGIVHICDQELAEGNAALNHLDARYVSGVTRQRVLLLDAEKLLSDPALIVSQ